MFKKYYTPAGAKRLNDRRESVLEQLRVIQSQKGEAAENGGNQWHDNFSFEDLSRQEMMMNQQLAVLSKMLSEMIVVRTSPRDTEKLCIGHIAVLDFGGETRIYRVGGYDESSSETNPPTVAYNAPLLQSFFEEEEGYQAIVNIGGKAVRVTLEEIRLVEVHRESDT